MERTKLMAARAARGLSQPELAEAIGASRESVSLWERGLATPHYDMILALCRFFKKDPDELDLAEELTEKELIMIQEILQNRTVNRRQALTIVTLPAFKGVDLSSLSEPLLSPGAFLRSGRALMDGCWYLLKHNGFTVANNMLKESEGALSDLTRKPSPYQYQAAHLAVEAKIIQSIIALHHLDHTRQESLYLEALDIAERAGDGRLQAAPLQWLGWLYKSHHRAPKRGIHFYNDALSRLDSDASFQRSSCLYGLSGAYSLDKKTRGKAVDLLLEAKATMPQDYVQNETDRLLDTGVAEFDRIEGIIYQNLHKLFPDENYARTAYEIFERGTNKPALAERTQSEILICQADAAYDIGDLGEYTKCLEKGMQIAIQIDSKKRKDEARAILYKADKWKHEERYKKLAKIF